jgi:3-hydroxyisobutyrate dehydrogenase-like beta-hydroxyacid dehydrogenase
MTPSPVRIGWIGTGRMGAALVDRLLEAGHDVAVYNRTRSKTEAMARRGAKVVDAPVDLAGCDVVFTMVSDSADLTQVTTGEGGLLTHASAVPSVVVDSSTVSPAASAKARVSATARGARLLAAPVSGNPKVVRAGRLTFAVSGPRDAFDQVHDLLLVLGRGATYLGEGEVARLAKICHNAFLGVVIQSLAEVTLLAERGGTSRAAFLEFLNDSVLGSAFTRYKTPALVNLDFTPTFTMPLLSKDFTLADDAARELGVPMPLASAAAQLVASAVGAGHRELDFATLILEQARRSGMTLEPENIAVDDGL